MFTEEACADSLAAIARIFLFPAANRNFTNGYSNTPRAAHTVATFHLKFKQLIDDTFLRILLLRIFTKELSLK